MSRRLFFRFYARKHIKQHFAHTYTHILSVSIHKFSYQKIEFRSERGGFREDLRSTDFDYFPNFPNCASNEVPKHKNADANTPPLSTSSLYPPSPAFSHRCSIAGGPASFSFRNEPKKIRKNHGLMKKKTKMSCRKWSVGVSDGATS